MTIAAAPPRNAAVLAMHALGYADLATEELQVVSLAAPVIKLLRQFGFGLR